MPNFSRVSHRNKTVSGHRRLSVLGLAGIQVMFFHRSLHGAVLSVDSTPMFSYC